MIFQKIFSGTPFPCSWNRRMVLHARFSCQDFVQCSKRYAVRAGFPGLYSWLGYPRPISHSGFLY